MKFLKKLFNFRIKDEKGIALFMVISTVSVLALLATEFIYVAQINQKMAYESVDQIRAHYLAKSALKISLLRLRIYQQVRSNEFVKKSGVPINQIWNFPFAYPLPQLPGMTKSQMSEIDKFQKNSLLEGQFTALIDSESSKFNINLLLPHFQPNFKKPDPNKNAPPQNQPSQNPAQPTNPNDPNAPQNPAGTTPPPDEPKFNVEEARESFSDFITMLFNQKKQEDSDFQDKYNNFEIQPLIDNMIAWVDYTFESQSFTNDKEISPKKAPLFDLSELHMIPLMDDELFKLISPTLTAGLGLNINVNTMQVTLLRAFFPQLTEEQAKKIMTDRENPQVKGPFSSEEDFYKVIQTAIGWDQKTLDDEKMKFQNRNINFVTEESTFKITVNSIANFATQNLEATVSLIDEKSPQKPTAAAPQNPQSPSDSTDESQGAALESQNAGFKNKKSGIKIDSMRFL